MLWITLAFALVSSGAEPVGWTEDLEERIDRAIERARAFWRVPGTVVAITDGQKIRYLKAHGMADAGTQRRMATDTVFPLASCTKAFTTLLAACLADDGALAWDDPVARHLPWFRVGGNAEGRPITLADAASHRSGYDAHDLLWYHRREPMRARVERLAGLAPEAPPGTRFRYQTTVYTAVGLATEAAGKAPWNKQVADRILKPIGLNETWLDAGAVPANRLPTGYRLDGDLIPRPVEPYPWGDPDPTASAHATAADMAAWLRFHMGDGSTGGARVVSTKAMAELYRPWIRQELTDEVRVHHPLTKGMAYGLGWLLFDHRGDAVRAHAGAIDGFRVQVTALPERKLGIVVFANLEMTRMNLALTNTIMDEVLGHPFRDYNGPYLRLQERQAAESLANTREELLKVAGRPAPAGTLAGTFSHPAYGDAVLTRVGDLWTLTLGPNAAPLLQQGPACWVAPGHVFGDAIVRLDGPDTLLIGGRVGVGFKRK